MEKLQQGDFMGMVGILYGHHFKEGLGGDYSSTRPIANGVLGLPKEDLDETTKEIVGV